MTHSAANKTGASDGQTAESATPFEANHKFLNSTLAALAGAEQQAHAIAQLDQLQTYLPAHFSVEEGPGGFFEQMVTKSPRCQGEVERLKQEHPRLLELLREAQTAMAAATTPGGPAVEALIAALKAHELAEDALLQEAMNRDLGIGD